MAGPTPLSSSAPPPDGPPAPRPPRRFRVGAWLAGLLLAVVLAAGGGAGWLYFISERPGPLTEAQDVVVPPGGTADVAARLAEAGVIASPLRFQILAWLSRAEGPLRAAEFTFPERATLRQVLAVLRNARPVEHRLTIPEGLTAAQITALVNRAEAAAGTVETIEEGSVLPETYAYDRGMARSVLVARARQAMERELAAAWANRSPDLQLSSPRELLILASIVERETSRPDERARVAAVYLNRLRIGMRLQADPTVVYAASNGAGVLDRKLTKADLERQDPYNTYRNAGLPPGPICSPGAASLAAVARPAKTEELFFVADGQGGHVFSRTWEAHERNVARWRALTGGPVATD
ncbi:MAG: endolytic transglycosylase MltG [Acetobacteraceae bacterium]